ncbi:MAG: radical SAM protein [Sedimentisphaerales bacterium]
MKILFLIPPPLDGARAAERIFGCNYAIYYQPNIFMLYPATILERAGHDITYMDFPANGKGTVDFEHLCKEQDFDIVFFYSVFLSKRTDIIARDMLHKENPKTRFIFIGTEPSANSSSFVDDNSIVIRGESESRVVPVVDALKNGTSLKAIPGISYTMNGEIVDQGGIEIIDDLDQLPIPDRTLLDSTRYNNPKLSSRPFAAMLTSRGCSFKCYYCVPNSLSFSREIGHKLIKAESKPPVRLRSPENIIAEVSYLAGAGYKSISFIDDQFVWGNKRAIEICEGIAPFGMEWSCLARADMLQDEDVVMAMARAGCKSIDIGIESFDQEILDYVQKDLKVETVYAAVKNLKRAGIEPELNILLASCPLETKETIERTFQEALRLDVEYVLFSICTPFPYTEFNRKANAEGWMIKPEYEPIDPIKESFISYPHLTKEELDRIIRRLYLRYYFRPAYIWKRLRKVRGFRDLLDKARAACTILR